MKKVCGFFAMLAVALMSLTACGGSNGPDMPMEMTINDTTVVLGETTMQELVDLGFEAHLEKVPDSAKDGDKFITFDYSLDQGAGSQFWVSVCVPWSGDTNINNETNLSASEGIVKSITVTKSASEDLNVVYNGVNLQDMSFETGEEWGATEDTESSKKRYVLEAKRGFVLMEVYLSSDTEFHSLTVQLTQKEFEAMQ